MIRFARWGFALVLLPLAGCGGGGEETAAATPPPAPAPAPPPLSPADTNFINMAAMSGIAEIQESQLASQRASRAGVRDFAEHMASDHTQMNQQLTQLAQKNGVTLPAQPDPKAQAEMQGLEKLRGRVFERQFLRHEVADHQQAVQMFQQEAQQGSNPDVKAFAQQSLPTLQQHLDMAQSLAGGHPMMKAPPKKEM